MKLISPKISILIGRDSTTIDVYDRPSSTKFLEITLTPQQLSVALSRIAMTDCEAIVQDIERVGKKIETTPFVFEIGDMTYEQRHSEHIKSYARPLIPEGWIADMYFSSKSSFFSKDGKNYAQTVIRRWL